VVSDTPITAPPAAGATTGKVTVVEAAGSLMTPQTLKVVPTIEKFTPTSGHVGASVVITGMGWSQTSAVKFGTVATSFVVNSNPQLTAPSRRAR
jgi:hypothetical protein